MKFGAVQLEGRWTVVWHMHIWGQIRWRPTLVRACGRAVRKEVGTYSQRGKKHLWTIYILNIMSSWFDKTWERRSEICELYWDPCSSLHGAVLVPNYPYYANFLPKWLVPSAAQGHGGCICFPSCQFTGWPQPICLSYCSRTRQSPWAEEHRVADSSGNLVVSY